MKNSGGSSNTLTVNNSGVVGQIDCKDSDLLVVNAGHIGYISTASGSKDPMNAITYDGSASGQPSILAVSLKPNTAQDPMYGALGMLSGGN